MDDFANVLTSATTADDSAGAAPRGSNQAVEHFVRRVAELALRDGRLLDTWNEDTHVDGLDEAVEAAEQLLIEPCEENPELSDGYRLRESEWEDLSCRIAFPRWGGDQMQIEWLLEGVRPIAERTLLAIYLQDRLEPAKFEAMTAAWRSIVGPVTGPNA